MHSSNFTSWIICSVKKLKWKIARLRVKTRATPKTLWVRYLLGLSLIFAVLVISHNNSLSVISSGKEHAQMINMGGQQRTLSQQIFILAERYYENPTPEDHVILSKFVNTFFDVHKELTSNENMSSDLKELYFDPNASNRLDADSRKFVAKVYIILTGRIESQKSKDAYDYIRTSAPIFLLGKLNRAVKQLENDAKSDVDALVFNQRLSLLGAALLLVIEFFVIFLPSQHSVLRAIRRLERHRKSLRSARSALAAKNDELNQSYDQMERAALHDALTGLANRRYLEQELDERLKRYAKDSGTMAVLHIDLDNFKLVNDTLGHAAGDFVLEQSARIFSENARSSDFISRVGGDEFVIVSDNRINKISAENIAKRILAAFEAPLQFNDEELLVGVSIGIDVFCPKEKVGENCVSQILTNADVALYLAKENGRNRYEVFTNEHYHKFIEQASRFNRL
jgi:diguanylate cyclase (GGDEF)-like protein